MGIPASLAGARGQLTESGGGDETILVYEVP
jgi:hypothetical protein